MMNAQFIRIIVREVIRRQNDDHTGNENPVSGQLAKYRACMNSRCVFCIAKYEAFRTGQATRFNPSSLRQKIMLDYTYYFHSNDLMGRIGELPLPETLLNEFSMVLARFYACRLILMFYLQIVDRLKGWQKMMSAILERSSDCYLYDLHWRDGAIELDLTSTARMMYQNARITALKKFRIAAITCDQQSVRTYYDQLGPVVNGSLAHAVCGTMDSFPGFYHILMYWFQKCANNDEANLYLKPALYQAIELHWFDIVQYLWPVISSVEEAVPGGVNYVRDHSFHLAVSRNNQLVVRYLWENCHQSESQISMVSSVYCCGSRNSYHSFLEAVRIGNFDLVHYMFSKSSPSDRHRMLLVDNCFAFIYAASRGFYSIVEYLLDNVQNANEKFMLFYAQHGAAIQRACRFGNLAVIKLLLANMSDDSMRYQQLTLGDCACLVQLTRYGHEHILCYLLKTYEAIRPVALETSTLSHILISSMVAEFDLSNGNACQMRSLKGFEFWFDNPFVNITSLQLAQCFLVRKAYELNLAFESLEPLKQEAFRFLVEHLEKIDREMLFGSTLYLRQCQHLVKARQILRLIPLNDEPKPAPQQNMCTDLDNQIKSTSMQQTSAPVSTDDSKMESLAGTADKKLTPSEKMDVSCSGCDLPASASVAPVGGGSSDDNACRAALVQAMVRNRDGHGPIRPPTNPEESNSTDSSSGHDSGMDDVVPRGACAGAASSSVTVLLPPHCSIPAVRSAFLGRTERRLAFEAFEEDVRMAFDNEEEMDEEMILARESRNNQARPIHANSDRPQAAPASHVDSVFPGRANGAADQSIYGLINTFLGMIPATGIALPFEPSNSQIDLLESIRSFSETIIDSINNDVSLVISRELHEQIVVVHETLSFFLRGDTHRLNLILGGSQHAGDPINVVLLLGQSREQQPESNVSSRGALPGPTGMEVSRREEARNTVSGRQYRLYDRILFQQGSEPARISTNHPARTRRHSSPEHQRRLHRMLSVCGHGGLRHRMRVEEMRIMRGFAMMDEADFMDDDDEMLEIARLQSVISAHALLNRTVNLTVERVIDIERRIGSSQIGDTLRHQMHDRRHDDDDDFHEEMFIRMMMRRCRMFGQQGRYLREVSYDRLTVQSQRLINEAAERVLYVVEHPREDNYEGMRMAELDDLVLAQQESRPSTSRAVEPGRPSGAAGTSHDATGAEASVSHGGGCMERRNGVAINVWIIPNSGTFENDNQP